MDYSGFTNFPFPAALSQQDQALKQAFLALPDSEQLNLLDGCMSYEEFHGKIASKLTAS